MKDSKRLLTESGNLLPLGDDTFRLELLVVGEHGADDQLCSILPVPPHGISGRALVLPFHLRHAALHVVLGMTTYP